MTLTAPDPSSNPAPGEDRTLSVSRSCLKVSTIRISGAPNRAPEICKSLLLNDLRKTAFQTILLGFSEDEKEVRF